MGLGKIAVKKNKMNIALDDSGNNLYQQTVEPTKSAGMIDGLKSEGGLGKLMAKKKRAKNVFELIRDRKL